MNKVPERIARYAASQWRTMMIGGRVFDQLGDTRDKVTDTEREREGVCAPLVAMTNARVVSYEKLAALVDALATAIVDDKTDWGKMRDMHVDYGPGVEMHACAVAVGLESMQWPIKSHVRIEGGYADDDDEWSVMTSHGYGAPSVRHYPLTDGRWVVCELTGADVAKVVALIESGSNPLDLRVVDG